MTDNELDNLIKSALTADDVPKALNEKLFFAASEKRRKKARIINFARVSSSFAAVFVCAVAVVSYFNTDIKKEPANRFSFSEGTHDTTSAEDTAAVNSSADFEKEVTSPKKEAKTAPRMAQAEQKKASPKQYDFAEEKPENSLSAASYEEDSFGKASPLPQEKVDSSPEASPAAESAVSAQSIATDEIPDTASLSGSTASPAMKARGMRTALSSLFNDDYDYKDAIFKKIIAQIENLPYADEVTFSSLNGDEAFSLDEDNLLTIEFPRGTIAPDKYGDLHFPVGTVKDGILI